MAKLLKRIIISKKVEKGINEISETVTRKMNSIAIIDEIVDSGAVMSTSSTEDEAIFLSSINVTAEVDTATQWGVGSNYDSGFYRNFENTYSITNLFEISTVGELAAFAKFINDGRGNFSGKTVSLKNDISLGGSGIVYEKSEPDTDNKYELTISGIVKNAWIPIGNANYSFNGIFDGGGFEIKEMVVLEKSNSICWTIWSCA